MKHLFKKVAVLLLTLSLLTGCTGTVEPPSTTAPKQDDIIILYTNDIHCGVDEFIGYAGLSAYKDYCESITPYTTLVDCGDAIQGGLIGTVSQGEYIVDIMNQIGYDFAILGNHEFDFGLEQLSSLIKKSNAKYLCLNLSYSGTSSNNILYPLLAPYNLVSYGDTTVAYIGVTTPHTLTSSTPVYFMENGEFVYQFHFGGSEKFYAAIQENIDTCKTLGADYVVLLSHLGDTPDMSPYSSVELIQNTTGIDAVLDGHSHSEIPCRPVKDAEGNTVLLSSTGTKLNNIGQLTISANGTLSTSLVSGIDWVNSETAAYIKQIQSQYQEQMNQVVATSQLLLSGYTETGVRLVRNRETTIGNLCADAYRVMAGADIGVVNGGGVRADISPGDVTYADIIAVHPFGNTLCMIELTGQELLDALEVAYSNVQSISEENGQPIGESGEFLHISGMKLTVDTSIAPSVTYDENGMLKSIGETRRVKNVRIQDENGDYLPIELQKTYTMASHNYYLKNNGGNHTLFDDNKLLIDESISDYEVLISYISNQLDGVIGAQYAKTEGRITIE